MHFVMYNLVVVLSKILKIVVPLEQNFEKTDFYSIKFVIFNILDNATELWMTKCIIGEIFSSGGSTLYKNPSDQTVIIYFFSKQTRQYMQYVLEYIWYSASTYNIL